MDERSTSNVPQVSDQDEDQINFLDLLQVVVENLWLLVIGPLACGLAALAVSFTITPTFKAKTQFLPPQQQQSAAANVLATLGSIGGLAGAAAGIKNPGEQYLAFLRSVSIQDALIDRFNLIEKFEAKLRDDARSALTGKAKMTSSKDGLISIEVDDKDPNFAADLANAYVEELRKLLGRLALTEAQQRRLFFEKQLQFTKEKLTVADVLLKSSGINSSVLKASPVAAVETVARLKAGISLQEVKLGAMRNYLTENSPEFKQAMSELSSLKLQLLKAEKDEPADKNSVDYVSRYREFKYQETMFELFTKQYELAKIDESREGAVIQVIDVAQPPERKAKPSKAVIAVITTVISGFALLLFVFVRVAIQNSMRNPQTKEKMEALKKSWKKALKTSM